MTSTISKKLRVLALMMVLVMLMPCVAGFGVAANVDDGLLTYEEVLEIGRMEAPAKKAYKEIVNAWSGADGDIAYPPYYGGCYINDAYMLAIKLVNGNGSLREQIEEIVSNDDILVFENVEISYSALRELQLAALNDYSHMDIAQVSVSQENNTVDIYVRNNASDDSQCTRNIGDNAHIRFIQTEDKPDYLSESALELPPVSFAAVATASSGATIYPGTTIYSSTGGTGFYAGTIGWFGTYPFFNTQNGNTVIRPCILTAGHVVEEMISNGNDVKPAPISSTVIVDADDLDDVSRRWHTQFLGTGSLQIQYGDYGYMTYSSEVIPVNKILVGTNEYKEVDKWSYYLSDLAEGTAVFKAAGISGYHAAEIDCTDTFVSRDNGMTRIMNVVSVDSGGVAFAQGGDSGSTIYYFDETVIEENENEDKSPFIVCGILQGGIQAEDLYYFTHSSVILESGFSPNIG